ncbi:NFACT RNA binding domain-containing protein [Adhaeribacter terreus]|uniref:NFACT RNA binding domain-containing protein n=1 Tax=Adhaeribacter terreus TaxID=529703 RepID=A0ABW0EG19_9BACT
MHLNYFFLKKLSAAMEQKLVGFTLATCFSQEKDELVLGFTNGHEDFYIKAILTSGFSALSFPSEFHRKRQNSVNLFPETVGKTVEKVVQHQHERSFYFELSEGLVLLFKMFGNRANIVVFQNRIPVNRFHKKFPADFELDPWHMDRHFTVSPAEFPLNLKQLQKILPTLGELPLAYLREQNFEDQTAENQQKTVSDLLQKLEDPVYYIIEFEGKIRLSLLPLGTEIAQFTNPIEASQFFAVKYLSTQFYLSNFQAIKQQLEKQKHSAEQILAQVESKQKSLKTDTNFAQTADVIMANLTNIPPRTSEIELYDFYQDRNRTIKLKATETPQKTAERLYKKAKNQQIELKILDEKALRKTEEIFALEEKLEELSQVTDSKTLKHFLKANDFETGKKTAQPESPFREFTTEGFRILVGKSAANNDVLTQKHTHKDDLWLHAKDVSGSHVVVKFQSGKTFPQTVIEKAAKLAAYYSKRKTDSLCPVIYTQKKYVRKPKGAAPGSVVVDRENVMLVTPENPFERTF